MLGSVSMGKPRLCLGVFGCNKLSIPRIFVIRYAGSKKGHSRKSFKTKSSHINVDAVFKFLVSLIGWGVLEAEPVSPSGPIRLVPTVGILSFPSLSLCYPPSPDL